MEILTWNIQAGTGVDGTNDMSRVVQIIKRMDNPDIICLQKVARTTGRTAFELTRNSCNTNIVS
jgi:endonuclease/exonuclease/phosphatase family metal-dependent hydrolase